MEEDANPTKWLAVFRNGAQDLGGFEKSGDPKPVVPREYNSEAAALCGLDCLDAPTLERGGLPGFGAHVAPCFVTGGLTTVIVEAVCFVPLS